MGNQIFIQVKWFVFDHFILTRNQFRHKVSQSSNEGELDDGIGNIKGPVSKGYGHLGRQMKSRFKPLNQRCKRNKEDNTDNRTNHVKGNVGTSNTFGSDIGSKRSNNSCNGRSDIITKENWESPFKVNQMTSIEIL